MYSYEERLLAVALYIKLGKRVGATIRELGISNEERPEGLASRIRVSAGLADAFSATAAQVLRGTKAGRIRALYQSRALHCMDAACLGLSRPSHADGMGARGLPRDKDGFHRDIWSRQSL